MTADLIKEVTDIYPVKIMRVHGLDDDEAVAMVATEQMALQKINFQMFTEQDDFIDHLYLKPNICFIDYKLPGKLNGVQITKIITDQYPDCRVIMISALKDFEVIYQFHNEAKGHRWIMKGDDWKKFIDDLVFAIQDEIKILTQKIEIQSVIHQLREEERIYKESKTQP